MKDICHKSIELAIDTLLRGSDKSIEYENKEILLLTINYFKSIKSFKRPLIDQLTLGSLYISLSLLSKKS